MEMRDYVRVLRRRWMSIIAFILVGVVLALLVTETTTKTYQASTKSFVSVSTVDKGDPSASVYQSSQFILQRVKSYTELADSITLLQPVITSLGLRDTVAGLASRVSVVNPTDTVILEVVVKDSQPARAADIANGVAAQLSTVIEQLEPGLNGKPLVTVAVTKRATAASSPVSPRPALNLALGLILGLALGIGWAVAREQLNRSVRAPEDMHRMLGSVPLGLIGRITAAPEPGNRARRSSGIDYAFSGLISNLTLADDSGAARRIAVVSAVGGEGRSLTALYLATRMANGGRQVCLVEADLRRPKLARYLDLPAGPGLSNYLRGNADVSEITRPVPRFDGLSVLLSGSQAEDPSLLLASKRLPTLLVELGRRFDFVIIDVPPLLPVPDAQFVLPGADALLFITRFGRATEQQVSEAIDLLAHTSAPIVGSALVGLPRSELRSFGYGYDQAASANGPSSSDDPGGPASTEVVGTSAGGSDPPVGPQREQQAAGQAARTDG